MPSRRRRLPPLERKFGFFSCSCDATWASAYVFCILGTKKVLFLMGQFIIIVIFIVFHPVSLYVQATHDVSKCRNLFQTTDISESIFWDQKIYFEIPVV